MSAGYAERLSEYPDKGVCGLPENCDSERAFSSKLKKLAELIQQSNYTVVLTGAGISTSAGIPDFRGPNGIWTREQQEKQQQRQRQRQNKQSSKIEKKIAKKNDDENGTDGNCLPNREQSNDKSTDSSPSNSRKRKQGELEPNATTANDNIETSKKFISFETASPTYTHRALTHLILHPPPLHENDGNKNEINRRTYLHHIVTQNVDGLHQKTNLPRENLSVLHGDIFTEICDTCHTEHVSATEIQSIGLKHTGRKCTLGGNPVGSCEGKLKDTLLDWEDDLPVIDWERAQMECYKADLVLCLGTSLRIEPAGGLCTYPTGSSYTKGKKKKKGGTNNNNKVGYAIVNLQQTPYDEGAALIVRRRVDETMRGLMEILGYGCDWDASGALPVDGC
mmetsp:Transcript_25820/g.54567  ORF Transcript_25820/g.54567 Transcript_25820/m.54567 type:complete len:393 (-) Transcript_25820:162-1340(-)